MRVTLMRRLGRLKQIYLRAKRYPSHVASISLLVIALGVGASSAGIFLSSLNLSDKLAAETVILTGAGFLLAMLAAIVAYRLSARVPKLSLEIRSYSFLKERGCVKGDVSWGFAG
jgi:hypothetical protein